jgi:hypothetical protein
VVQEPDLEAQQAAAEREAAAEEADRQAELAAEQAAAALFPYCLPIALIHPTSGR